MARKVNKPVVGGAAALAIAVGLIAPWEGKKNDPYKDIVGVWTVCYGETRVQMRTYTDQECLQMLNKATAEFQAGVVKCVPGLATRPYQLGASTSLAYNIGTAAFCRSTAARKFNAGDWEGGCNAFRMWRFAGDREVRGLVNRRNAEVRVCLTGLS